MALVEPARRSLRSVFTDRDALCTAEHIGPVLAPAIRRNHSPEMWLAHGHACWLANMGNHLPHLMRAKLEQTGALSRQVETGCRQANYYWNRLHICAAANATAKDLSCVAVSHAELMVYRPR